MTDPISQSRSDIDALRQQVEELRRIRELCIKSLVKATGYDRDAIEDAPFTCATKHAAEVAKLRIASETKEWIPVGERLPPPNPLNDSNSVRVLMYSPDTSRPEYRTEVGCLWYAQNVWMADRARHVTHWMPIPKEPK